jgi:uncharacterized protein (DUF934 family)
MRYFTNGAFADDPWAGREVLTLAEFNEREAAGTLPQPLGLRLDPGVDVQSIAANLEQVKLIAIAFPKFTDGRGYSMGWLLRRRLGYEGEMRAVGDVLFDEMQFMVRCGFDAFEISDPSTLKLLSDGRRAAAFDHFYQPGLEPEVPAGTRPWARRAATRASGNPV